MSVQRYAEMIRELVGGKTEWRVDPKRRIDGVVAAHWGGRTEGLGGEIVTPAGRLAAADGETVAVSAWAAVALGDTGVLEQIATAQQASGAYFVAGPADNLETLWYWELVVLHAMAAGGIRTGSPPLLESARRAATYHLNETQPDHATTEPWGLNAFLLSTDTWPLADQVLHTVRVQHPHGVAGVSGILLADTLRGIERGW